MIQSPITTTHIPFPEAEVVLTHPDFQFLLERWLRVLALFTKKTRKAILEKTRRFVARLKQHIDESAEIQRRLTRAREARYSGDFHHLRGVL